MAPQLPHQRVKVRGEYGHAMERALFLAQRQDDSEHLQSSTQKEPSIPMNAGLGAKSVKSALTYPCTYKDCTYGFKTSKRLRAHKNQEHDYCYTCDKDFVDDVALVGHRIESTLMDEGKHIACLVCGQDFGSEAGRETHFKQVSNTHEEAYILLTTFRCTAAVRRSCARAAASALTVAPAWSLTSGTIAVQIGPASSLAS